MHRQTHTHARAQETIVKNDEHGGVIQSGPCGIIDLSPAIMCFLLCKRRAETGREEMSTHTDKASNQSWRRQTILEKRFPGAVGKQQWCDSNFFVFPRLSFPVFHFVVVTCRRLLFFLLPPKKWNNIRETSLKKKWTAKRRYSMMNYREKTNFPVSSRSSFKFGVLLFTPLQLSIGSRSWKRKHYTVSERKKKYLSPTNNPFNSEQKYALEVSVGKVSLSSSICGQDHSVLTVEGSSVTVSSASWILSRR